MEQVEDREEYSWRIYQKSNEWKSYLYSAPRIKTTKYSVMGCYLQLSHTGPWHLLLYVCNTWSLRSFFQPKFYIFFKHFSVTALKIRLLSCDIAYVQHLAETCCLHLQKRSDTSEKTCTTLHKEEKGGPATVHEPKPCKVSRSYQNVGAYLQ
jgi:hypothetical protein